MSRSERGYHHGDLDSAIERAALDLVDEVGHGALSLREVARRAGVSHSAPYHHVGDKASLLARLGASCMADLIDELGAAHRAARTATPRERAARVASAYIHYAAAHRSRFRLLNDPDVCDPRNPSPTMAPLLDRVHVILGGLVDELDPNAAPEHRGALRTAIWGAVHGLAELVLTGQIAEDETAPALAALLRD